MSISNVNGARRVSSSTADPPVPVPATPQGGDRYGALVELDDTTHQPLPPRFPWLSRLTAQLESVARQKSPFTSAPLLGDNLDQAV